MLFLLASQTPTPTAKWATDMLLASPILAVGVAVVALTVFLLRFLNHLGSEPRKRERLTLESLTTAREHLARAEVERDMFRRERNALRKELKQALSPDSKREGIIGDLDD